MLITSLLIASCAFSCAQDPLQEPDAPAVAPTFRACKVILIDETNNPISGVRVTLENVATEEEIDSDKTDSDGLFSSTKLDPKLGRVLVIAKWKRQVFTWKTTPPPMIVQLKPKVEMESSTGPQGAACG